MDIDSQYSPPSKGRVFQCRRSKKTDFKIKETEPSNEFIVDEAIETMTSIYKPDNCFIEKSR